MSLVGGCGRNALCVGVAVSIDADTIQILLDADMGGAEILAVAKGMQRGPDASIVYTMIEALREVGTPAKAIAIAVLEVAKKAAEADGYARFRGRDSHTSAKDSNKSRRGLSNKRWREIRLRVLERDEWQCQYCGDREDLTCDHIVPLARGGGNEDENLTAACRRCNSSKGDKTPAEWLGLQ